MLGRCLPVWPVYGLEGCPRTYVIRAPWFLPHCAMREIIAHFITWILSSRYFVNGMPLDRCIETSL